MRRQPRERPAAESGGGADTHVELLDGGSATLVGSDDLHLHDLDGVGAGTMASSHIPI